MQEASQFPCNTRVSVKGVEDVAGNKGPQWKLTCEFPWTGQFPETLWVDTMPDWKPTAGETYDCVVNRRDLKKDKDADTEWNWRHYINSFTPDPVLEHWQKPGYSAPSNQSAPGAPDSTNISTPVPVSSGTIGHVMEGGAFGSLLKAAIYEEKDTRVTGEPINYERIQELFLDLADVQVLLKSLPMPTVGSLPVPLQDDEPSMSIAGAINDLKGGIDGEPDWSDEPEPAEQEEMPF